MTTHKAQDLREYRRQRAYELKKDNWPAHRIAHALGVSRGALSQGFKRLREAGDDPSVLAPKPRPGAPPKLSLEKLAHLPSQRGDSFWL